MLMAPSPTRQQQNFPAISANYSVDEAAYLTELLQLADPGEAGIAAIANERAR